MKLLVLGPGYSAKAAIARLRGHCDQIVATARSDEQAAALLADHVQPIAPEMGAVRDAIADASHLLVSVPPDDIGDPMLRLAAEPLASARHLRSVVYLSTVGVYGDHGGAWIDEETVPAPKSRRSVARLEAEAAWQAIADKAGWSLAILRLSGIYGPGRNALVNLAKGTARRLVKPGQVFNRIHVADIAAAVDAAMSKELSGAFNVTDDLPAPPQDVVAFAAELMGVEPPPEIPFETADLTPMARSFYGENKRVSNARMKQEMSLELAFPTYRDGLQALWKSGEGQAR